MATKSKKTPTSDRIEIHSDDYVSVMNICPMPLTLTTEPYGGGKAFNFSKFGEVKKISYPDLVRIIESHQNFVEKGFFYILDERVVNKHGLAGTYATLLTEEKMLKILEGSQGALELFRVSNDTQRNFIKTLLVRKIRDEEYVDYAFVQSLDKEFKLNILKEGMEAKELKAEFSEAQTQA